MIITIDGLSSSGKGTIARKIAEKYNLYHLDTGLLFRAIAYNMMKDNIAATDLPAIIEIANQLNEEQLIADKNLRDNEISNLASTIATQKDLRESLGERVTYFINKYKTIDNGIVLDGRDTGTIMCPQADLKFFIQANEEIRTQRRLKELQEYGIKVIYDDVLQAIQKRDMRDMQRKHAPLLIPADAIKIDTSYLTIGQVVEVASAHIDKIINVI